MTPASTVYRLTNSVNGHTYIGVTRFTPEYRFAQHLQNAASGRESYLYRAIRKYGSEAFSVEAVASCWSRDDSSWVERSVIQRERPRYNQTNGGEATTGRRTDPESVARIAAKNRGQRRTPKQCARIRAAAIRRYEERPYLRDVHVRIINSVRGLVDQDKRRTAAGNAARGRVWSEESRRKLSASCMGRRYGPEVHAKVAAKKYKRVYCQELEKTFGSVSEAATNCGLSISGVSKVARGLRNSANGLTFTFVTH